MVSILAGTAGLLSLFAILAVAQPAPLPTSLKADDFGQQFSVEGTVLKVVPGEKVSMLTLEQTRLLSGVAFGEVNVTEGSTVKAFVTVDRDSNVFEFIDVKGKV